VASSVAVVTARRFDRRWLLVAGGGAAVVGLAVAGDLLPALPAGNPAAPAAELRAKVLASAAQPYTGLAISDGRLPLPDLPQLDQVSALLTDKTRIRVFYAGPDRWRVDELTLAGERGTYREGDAEAVWDFSVNQLSRIQGATPVRPPRAADLLPAELGRRLVGLSAGDRVEDLPARRVAGRDAPGFRVSPSDPDTLVHRVDVWVDEPSGLPLRVEVAGRDNPVPVLITEMRSVELSAPPADVLAPTVPPGAGEVTVQAADVTGALRELGAAPPPTRLAGRDRVQFSEALPGVGVYGSGLAGFALIPVNGRIAGRALQGALDAGGAAVPVPAGSAVLLRTPLVSLVVRGGIRRGGALLVGPVLPQVLEQAVRELSTGGRP
jgi:hypothetical protein